MKEEPSISPLWNSTTKLVVALSFVGISALLLIFYRQIVGPLLLAFILSYLLHPVASRLKRSLRSSWQLAVTLTYLVLFILFLGLLTGSGVVIITQVQSLVDFLQRTVQDIPSIIDQITHRQFMIGPFFFDTSTINLNDLSTRVMDLVQGLFSEAGTLLGNLASGAALTIGWSFFVLLVSYFILAETGGTRTPLVNLAIPGYEEDGRRMGLELSRIWNSFLRNQLIISGLTILIYTILLGALGIRYYFGLALLAGLAKFLPYIGPLIAWSSFGLVAYFQGTTILGMTPITYTMIAVAIPLVIDMIIDNFLYYRLMGDALNAHPAAVMVAVIVGLEWIGFIGVILAAPVLATLLLFGKYSLKKMFDQDPWKEISLEARQAKIKKSNLSQKWKKIRNWIILKFKKFNK